MVRLDLMQAVPRQFLFRWREGLNDDNDTFAQTARTLDKRWDARRVINVIRVVKWYHWVQATKRHQMSLLILGLRDSRLCWLLCARYSFPSWPARASGCAMCRQVSFLIHRLFESSLELSSPSLHRLLAIGLHCSLTYPIFFWLPLFDYSFYYYTGYMVPPSNTNIFSFRPCHLEILVSMDKDYHHEPGGMKLVEQIRPNGLGINILDPIGCLYIRL